MTIEHGFELLREQELAELSSAARLYRHAKTGAELLSLINDDENKVFGVTFRTPPSDSTGVAHILEHSVLCGSRKYPVKEPFVELMKGSLNTFLNAFTYPDKTCYPVASQNLQDFYNLIDVYLDAVFHPLLAPHTFQQEGWHYELDSVDAPLVYKGVVFNEMKGAYSSPDNLLARLSQTSLFPDTTYGVDSGGDPTHIPDLTHAQLKSFHARHYHPSNARLFFYGDDSPNERLRLLDGWLRAFDPIEVDSKVGLQERFAAPKELTRTYIAGKDERDGGKALLTVNWMIDEVTDVATQLALAILNHILIGTPASPLRKALIDSGLGEAQAGDGLDSDLRQPVFSIGLRGINAVDAAKVEALILDTLRTLARKRIDQPTIDAAVNTVEFSLRENNTGSFPRGIALMLRALTSWLYDRDPLARLAFEAPLGTVKARIAAGERIFEELIRRNLLDNRHRTTLILRPDPDQAEREAEEERARLDAARTAMSKADLAAAVETKRTLRRLQEAPDTPEALATIPSLKLSDLPRQNKPLPLELTETRATRVLYHDLATNGIVYVDLGFDLHTLPADLLPYVPLFGRALLETGAGAQDFVRLSERIGRWTGGIEPETWAGAIRNSDAGAAWLFLRAKAMPEQSGELLAILRDVLLEARLDSRERFRQLVLEEKASLEAALVPMGLRFVNLRLRASLHEADWADEQMRGISYLFFLRRLADRVDSDWDTVKAALEQMRRTLVDRATMLCNVTTDAANWRRFEPQLAEFLGTLPLSSASPVRWATGADARCEGLTIPAKVNYVGKGANLHRLGYTPRGATLVIVKHVSATWLWDKVRVQGGAYGGRCTFDRLSGGFTFLSYRDPNLVGTLSVYDQTADFLRAANLSEAELTRSIIGTIGDVDFYRLPDAKGFISMLRHLTGDTDESRQRMREEILSAGQADFRDFAAVLAEVAARGRVVVLGAQEAIAAANAERPGFLQVETVL